MLYTVVGYFEDNDQIWIEHTEAGDPASAVTQAAKQLMIRNGWDEPNDILIVEVFAGHHRGLNERDNVSAAKDWPQSDE